MAEKKKKPGSDPKPGKNKSKKETSGETGQPEEQKGDYWDRIADDVASGYGAEQYKKKDGKDGLMNEDEEKGDHERADL
jgi:hypothetical protein